MLIALSAPKLFNLFRNLSVFFIILCFEFDRTGFPQAVSLGLSSCDHAFLSLQVHRFFSLGKVHVLALVLPILAHRVRLRCCYAEQLFVSCITMN